MLDALRSTRAISRCDCVHVCLRTLLPTSQAQQIRKLCSMVPVPCSCACDGGPRRSFHLHGPLCPAPSSDLRESSEKTGAPTRGSTLPRGERCPLLLETVSRRPLRGRQLGLCVPGCADERTTSVCGDDWEAGFNFGPVSCPCIILPFISFKVQTSSAKTFAYLRRLGYIVTRAKPPSPAYPVPAAYPASQLSSTASIFRRIFHALCSPIRRFLSWLVRPSTSWWRPLMHRRWLHHNMDYRTPVFQTISSYSDLLS
jgi:hypothetical protein